jgi:hypothetical protein
MTIGTIDFNGATYSAAGLAVTAAQWGASTVGHSRQPDFVLFGVGTAAATDNATTAGTALRWNRSTGKVTVYGTEPLVDEEGLGEDDAAADNTTATFLAIWVTPAAGGPVTA